MEETLKLQQGKRTSTRGPRRRNAVKIFALGGLGEIGKNMYGIEYKDEIAVIDAGVKFPRSDLPGVDYIIPDIRYLLEKKNQVKGIFLTHGHEDHIGGLPYLLRQLNVPVYGAPLTIGLVRSKLEEHQLLKQSLLHVVKEDTIVQLGRLRIQFFRTNHSIPDSLGIAVTTPEGTVVHTGDFKFDLTPADYPANLFKMAELGRKGVLALLSDSTNSEKSGYTPSEQAVGKAIYNTIRSCKGRILFATFASNVHRLQQVVEAAEATGRKIAVLGRSMDRVFRIGQELGYIRIPKEMLIAPQHLNKYEDGQLIVICTGSQGESNAALSRIANGSHPHIHIHPEDTVIFSSSPIPGNTQSINRSIDKLSRAGAHVIYGSVIDVHASGHGCQEDLKLMLGLMKPQYFVPIHGEYRMLLKHAQIAEQLGVQSEHIFILDIGQTVRLTKASGSRGRNIPSGEVFVSGNEIGEKQVHAIEDRKQMSSQGVVFVLLAVDKESGKIVSGPEIISRGFVYIREANKVIQHAVALVRKRLERLIRSKVRDEEKWKKEIAEALSLHFERTMKRNPLIVPVVIQSAGKEAKGL